VYGMQDWAEVHRLFHRERVPKARIARQLGMSRNTVDRLLGLSEPPMYVRTSMPSKLDPFKDQVRAMVAADPAVPATVVLQRRSWRTLRPVGEGRRARIGRIPGRPQVGQGRLPVRLTASASRRPRPDRGWFESGRLACS
jgi:hypothetical protein